MTERSEGLRVINPGMLTLLQDLGRFGSQHLGLTTGGAADEHAYLWANRLLGNNCNRPTLEITVGGLELEAHVATRIAIAGADLAPSLNGRPIHTWQTHNIAVGDRIRFGHARYGVHAYLAVHGGFTIRPTFGSVSTVMREGIGGVDGHGSCIQANDWLPCGPASPKQNVAVPARFVPDYRRALTLQLIEAQCREVLGPHCWHTVYNSRYQVDRVSNRMGVKLTGERLKPASAEVISQGVAFGTVQLPPDGQPVVLLKDRQTIGGYAKMGTVFALDAFALAQRPATSSVRFAPLQLSEAQRRLRVFYEFFDV